MEKVILWGRYGNVILQQQWEDMIQEVSTFYVFSKLINLVVDKLPHSQGTKPYLDISKIWSIQLLLLDFVIMQW